MSLEDLPLRIVLDWDKPKIIRERARVAGIVKSSQKYLDVLDTALAELT